MEYNDAVYELQLWLRELHFSGHPIEELIPDGIFDAKTRKAVADFQRYANLPVSGVADRQTWDAVYSHVTSARFNASRPNPIYPFPETDGYVLTPNEVSDTIKVVQIMLTTLAGHYGMGTLEVSGVYDEPTRAFVSEFQKRSGIAPNGLVDKETWNALTGVYRRLNRIDT